MSTSAAGESVPASNFVVPKPVAPPRTEREVATMAEVDALLDKIAVSGIGSLTPKERAKLEAAREDLMKRGAGQS